MDGNDWPDLALGHDPTTLYGNDGGTMSISWTSTAGYFGHNELRSCDVDQDGDEDLAEVHFSNGQVHIYVNNDGVLDSAPSWTYDSPTVGTAIAFGDINGDEWPDLIVGNSGDPSVKVFYSQPPEPTIPAISEWGLIATALLLFSAGTIMIRRRRSAT